MQWKRRFAVGVRSPGIWFIGLIALVSIVSIVSRSTGPRQYGSWDLTIATATLGGTYHAVGTQLAAVLTGALGEYVSVTAQESKGSTENIDRLVKARTGRDPTGRPQESEDEMVAVG